MNAQECDEAINIAGILIHVLPENAERVEKTLLAIKGVEVHERTSDGRMVVIVETDTKKENADAVLAVHRVDGVISASLIYNHFENPESTENKETLLAS